MLFYELMILLSQNSLFRGPRIFYQDVSSILRSPSFKDNKLVLCSDTLGDPWIRFYSFIYTIYKISQTLCWYLKAWPPHTRNVVIVSFLLVTNDACAVHIKKTYPNDVIHNKIMHTSMEWISYVQQSQTRVSSPTFTSVFFCLGNFFWVAVNH